MLRKFANFGKLFTVAMLLILALALAPMPSQAPAAAAAKTYEKWGPRVDYILMKIYGTYEAEVSALTAGEIDMMDWPLDKETYDTISEDPNYEVMPLTMYDFYDIDINTLRFPTSDVNFRRAIAYLIDYETFYTTVLRGYSGVLMDSIIYSEWTDWYNQNTVKYSFSRDTAKATLDQAGFQDWDSDGDREYKNASGVFQLPPLMFYAREDDPLRTSLGDMLKEELTAVGIPVDYHVAAYEVCSAAAYENYEYHLYTAGAGPFNDPMFLYDYYYSEFGDPSQPWAMNNVFFNNTEYDYWAERVKFATDEASAMEACKKCQEIFMDQVPLIPVYHSAGTTARRVRYGNWAHEEAYFNKTWEGMVNSENPTYTTGVNDWWTLLNAHPKGVSKGGVLRYGMMNDATVINPVMQYWYWDMLILYPIYDTLLMYDPYYKVFVPWLAKDYKIETWNNEGQNATKLTIKLYDSVKWHDGRNLTSADVAFTMKYMYDASSPAFYSYVEPIDRIGEDQPHIETPDPYTVVIYYSFESIWALKWAGTLPIIPKHVWENIPAEECETKGEFVTTGNLTGSGPFVIASHTEGQSWVLAANRNYFRRLAGDVDANAKVDIKDITMLTTKYTQKVPAVSPILDQNGDQIINIQDITFVAINYGRTG